MTNHAQVLKNAAGFLERVQATGQECYAWVEAHSYLLNLARAAEAAAAKEAEQPVKPAVGPTETGNA